MKKFLIFLGLFFLITVVASVLQSMRGSSLPQVSDAILLVGLVLIIGFLLMKVFKKFSGKNTQPSPKLQLHKEVEKEEREMEPNKQKNGQLLKVFGILTTLILVIITLASWFYWFQFRPTEIRKECDQERESYLKAESVKIQDRLSRVLPGSRTSSGSHLILLNDPTNVIELEAELNKNADQQGQSIYKSCLNSKGLNGT